MAKKKSGAGKPQYGKLIRVSDEFFASLNDATSITKMTVAEFADTYLLPVTRNRYRAAVEKEYKRLEGGGIMSTTTRKRDAKSIENEIDRMRDKLQDVKKEMEPLERKQSASVLKEAKRLEGGEK